MAALRPCPPSGLVVGAQRLGIGSSSRVLVTSQLGGHSTSLLKTDHMVITSDHVALIQTEEEFNKFRKELKKHCELDKDMPFREDILKIDEYSKEMTSWNTSIFHMRATALSLHLCMVVRKGVELASRIMESAAIRLDNKQDEISFHTTKQTIMMYVSIFVNLAEDTYHKKFNMESVFSLLGAFRGMAAISHILVQDAMASVNYADDNSSEYSLVHDIENSRRQFVQKMRNLEQKFKAVSNSSAKAYEVGTFFLALCTYLFFYSSDHAH